MALFQEMKQRHGTALSTSTLARMVATQGDGARAGALHETSDTSQRQAEYCLWHRGLAGVVETQGKDVWAARLWGSAEALRKAIDAPLPPVERPSYERAVAQAHARLGARTFAASWTEGRGMIPEDVLGSDEDR